MTAQNPFSSSVSKFFFLFTQQQTLNPALGNNLLFSLEFQVKNFKRPGGEPAYNPGHIEKQNPPSRSFKVVFYLLITT